MGTATTLTSADGFVLGAYRAEPEGTPVGGIVVIQEIFGVNSHIRSVADRYAEHGFVAVAPALFDRIEPGVELGYEDDDIAAGIDLARGKTDPKLVMDDLAAAAASVAGIGGGTACVGYCWGGMLAARCAIELPDRFTACVSYYGGGIASLAGGTPLVPLIAHFGELDHAIPLTDVDTVRAAWPAAEIHVHAGAQHGFNCDQRASYDGPTAATAFDQTLAFLARNAMGRA
jgi:carboxymethylenebutenolidase